MCNAVNELFADQARELKAIIADMGSQLADKDSQLADKDSLLADKDAIIEKLEAQIELLRMNTNNCVDKDNNR